VILRCVAKHNRSLRQWFKDDTAGYLGPRKVVQLFKAHPKLWLLLIVYLGVPVALYGGVLAAIGKLDDDFGTWAFFASMVGASAFGARLHSIWQMHQR
jgi:hypothetical protein